MFSFSRMRSRYSCSSFFSASVSWRLPPPRFLPAFFATSFVVSFTFSRTSLTFFNTSPFMTFTKNRMYAT